jgi:hypothetical protein
MHDPYKDEPYQEDAESTELVDELMYADSFHWVDDGEYVWAPGGLTDAAGNTVGEFDQIASKWHSGMDDLYSLHSHWFGHTFRIGSPEFTSEILEMREAILGALGDIQGELETKLSETQDGTLDDSSIDELEYLIDTLESNLTDTLFAAPAAGRRLRESVEEDRHDVDYDSDTTEAHSVDDASPVLKALLRTIPDGNVLLGKELVKSAQRAAEECPGSELEALEFLQDQSETLIDVLYYKQDLAKSETGYTDESLDELIEMAEMWNYNIKTALDYIKKG